MAVPLGINKLKPYRRHETHCTRYPGKKKPNTYKPETQTQKQADTCKCIIWIVGYLAGVTEIVNGKTKPKRQRGSLAVRDWAAADAEIEVITRRGSIEEIVPAEKPVDTTGMTSVQTFCEYYLKSRKNSLFDQIADSTYDHYASLCNQRWIPYCEANGIIDVKVFEDRKACTLFTQSWKQLRRNVGQPLDPNTARTELQRFRTILRSAIEDKFISTSGAALIKRKKRTDQEREEEENKRYGLEMWEWLQILDAPDSTHLTELQNREARVAAKLMSFGGCGMRVSDAHKFNQSEVHENPEGGWIASFIQKKNGNRCITPLPENIKRQLDELPGRYGITDQKTFVFRAVPKEQGGVKHFFSCNYSALRERIQTLGDRAKKDKPFIHKFTPHCLRHTFAIQNIYRGTKIPILTVWLGHSDESITTAHYKNIIESMKIKLARESYERSQQVNAEMDAEIAVLRSQMNADLTNSSATPLGTR